jgi:hypothetical protein
VALDPDLQLTPINGDPRTIREWVTNFHLLVCAVDPYTNESSWILATATKILSEFRGADVRVAWLSTSSAADAKAFLGPLAGEFLTFADPDRVAVKGLGLNRLPALVHIGTDVSIVGKAEGWHSDEWGGVCRRLATIMSWAMPTLGASAPSAFEGSLV